MSAMGHDEFVWAYARWGGEKASLLTMAAVFIVEIQVHMQKVQQFN